MIERRCAEDIAFRFLCANEQPDHSTIARFLADHDAAPPESYRTIKLANLGLVELTAADAEAVAVSAAINPLGGYAREVPLRVQMAVGWKPADAASADSGRRSSNSLRRSPSLFRLA